MRPTLLASLVAPTSLALVAWSWTPSLAQRDRIDVDLLLRVGRYVEDYFARAQTIVGLERVRLQPLGPDLLATGRARELLFEIRAEWAASPSPDQPPIANVVRQALKVDGRPPKANDRDSCMDPRPITPEPLVMLLPGRQRDFVFRHAGDDREGGQAALVLEYRPVNRREPTVEWRDQCVSVDLDGSIRGKVWVVPSTGQVLRLDEESVGMVDVQVPKALRLMTLERVHSSIRYRLVTFTEPIESLMLPHSIETVVVWRNAGVPRLRTWQSFSNYQRFVTGGRIVR